MAAKVSIDLHARKLIAPIAVARPIFDAMQVTLKPGPEFACALMDFDRATLFREYGCSGEAGGSGAGDENR